MILSSPHPLLISCALACTGHLDRLAETHIVHGSSCCFCYFYCRLQFKPPLIGFPYFQCNDLTFHKSGPALPGKTLPCAGYSCPKCPMIAHALWQCPGIKAQIRESSCMRALVVQFWHHCSCWRNLHAVSA